MSQALDFVKGGLESVVDRIDSIANTLSGFGTSSDKGAAGRPVPLMPLSTTELRWLYRGNGHARAAVDRIADHATVKGWSVNVPVIDDDADNDTDIDTDVAADTGLDVMHAEDARLNVWSTVGDAYRWARRDGGAWVLIVTDEDFAGDDTGIGERLAQPIGDGSLQRVDNLVVLTREEVTADHYDGDIRSPNFRRPKVYRVNMASGGHIERGSSGHLMGGRSVRVHHSRMIYFGGAKLTERERFENDGVDDSILQAWWDQVRNLTTIEQAGANLAQEMALHVVKVGSLGSMESMDQLRYFDARMKLLARSKSSVGLIVLGDDEEYQTISANVTGFKEFFGAGKDALAAVSGLPQTVLFGSAPGGLTSDDASGKATMNDLVAIIQANTIEAPLAQLYAVLFSQTDGPTAGVVPEDWYIKFHPRKSKSDGEQAALEKTHAETDALRITSQVVTPEHVTESRFGPAGYQNELAAVDVDDFDLDFEQAEEQRKMIDIDIDPDVEADVEAAPAALGIDIDPDVEAAPVEKAQDSALNGAQVTAALAIVEKVVAGVLTEAMAKSMLETFFNLTPEAASDILKGSASIKPPAADAGAVDGE